MTPESFLSWEPLIWGQGSEKHETSRVPAYLCFGVPGSSKDVAAFIVSGGTKVLGPELPLSNTAPAFTSILGSIHTLAPMVLEGFLSAFFLYKF